VALDEPSLSKLGLGCSRIGSFNNPQPLKESIALIQAALDLGITTIDTANIYGQGDSECAIGRAIRGRRDQAFVVTKTGKAFSKNMRLLRWLKPVLRPILAVRGAGASAVTARREEAMREIWDPGAFALSLNQSLRRLGMDHVDGFLLHSPPAIALKNEAIATALLALKQGGKTRHIGISCDDMKSLEVAIGLPGITLLQLPINLLHGAETLPIADQIREKGIIVFAREVIALQPTLTPAAAIRGAVQNSLVTSTLVGTTNLTHLRQLAAFA
jgi:aryl-alcohol dehydrogenase-like predicted oxidoreductase